MDHVLLAGPPAELAPLQSQLEGGAVLVERAQELEQAIRSSRAAVVVVADSLCNAPLLRRIRHAHSDRMFVAWLPRTASARAAELLEQGYIEVLSPAMARPELSARLRNARERRPLGRHEPASLGPLAVDAAHGLASWAGADLGLTRRERAVLQALVEAAPGTVRREDLYRSVWGYAMARGDRTVDVNVTRLRAKLAAVTDELVVATEPGVGYRVELRQAAVPVTAL